MNNFKIKCIKIINQLKLKLLVKNIYNKYILYIIYNIISINTNNELGNLLFRIK